METPPILTWGTGWLHMESVCQQHIDMHATNWKLQQPAETRAMQNQPPFSVQAQICAALGFLVQMRWWKRPFPQPSPSSWRTLQPTSHSPYNSSFSLTLPCPHTVDEEGSERASVPSTIMRDGRDATRSPSPGVESQQSSPSQPSNASSPTPPICPASPPMQERPQPPPFTFI